MVELFGGVAGVVYREIQSEVQRRLIGGTAGVVQLDVLDTLMNLPDGFPVQLATLDADELAVLAQLPPGVVEISVDLVRRVLTAPLAVDLAVVGAQDWRSGLKAAGRFAPYCERAVLLRQLPQDLPDAAVRASFYGVGLFLAASEGFEMLVEPRPYVRHRHTAAQWQFAERVWQQVSGPDGRRSTPSGPSGAVAR
ncbi:hypothetical protein [Kribbella sp. DT2]|uniref:hypothetical protein n=1 Tax=Kribbella sp. DT2 TaxID=3393427 RepID=UPI003CE75E7B